MLISFRQAGKWMCPACLICSKRWVNNASGVHYTQMRHHSADHLHTLKDYLRIEKDYLWIGKTIYGLKKAIYSFISAEQWIYLWSHDALLPNQWTRILSPESQNHICPFWPTMTKESNWHIDYFEMHSSNFSEMSQNSQYWFWDIGKQIKKKIVCFPSLYKTFNHLYISGTN